MYSARRRPQAAKPVFRRGVSRSAFLIWKKRHGAPAAWLGAKGMYLICPILRHVPLSLSKNNKQSVDSRTEKGAVILLPLTFTLP